MFAAAQLSVGFILYGQLSIERSSSNLSSVGFDFRRVCQVLIAARGILGPGANLVVSL